jgi:two-component system phosphate regulon sensor histidine kinase PhoR
MRWWLAATFVLIAALTAVVVAIVASRQADSAVRANSEDVAVGKTVSAAFAVEQAIEHGDLAGALPVASARRDLALFVFGRDRRLITSPESHGIPWRAVPDGGVGLAAALQGRRFVQTSSRNGATLVALPLRHTAEARALVAYAPRPAAYGTSLSIFRREVARAVLWSILVAGAVGVFAASLIARRLRRIGAAAAAIEQGRLDVPLKPGFGDEVGALALTIDRMRSRLRMSFEQVRADRDRLARLLQQLHEGVIAVDSSGKVRFANARATSLMGPAAAKPAEALPVSWEGVPLLELARGLFRPDALVAEARTDVEDGRMVSVAGVPAGASELAVIVLTDITEQERRERSEREFVANASHELRTPVSAIVSAVEALQAGAKDDPADRDRFVELIGRQAGRLARLTRSLLLLARAQSQQEAIPLEPVELAPLLQELSGSSEPSRSVVVDCPADLFALAQRDIVEQVVANLVENALNHSNGTGAHVRARRDDATVVIEVVDRGPGIPPSAEGRIFERFYSGHGGRRDGFGLGLAIARDAVRALGGTIEIRSQEGSGTTVEVRLALGAPR